MKVLINLRQDAYTKYGGDILHAEKTAEYARRLGVEVDISTDLSPDLSSYDLVHLFNMDWVRDPYLQALNAQNQHKPIVLSPLHHNFAEINEFERTQRYDFRRFVNPIFRSYVAREYLKNTYRALLAFNLKIWKATIIQWKVGIRQEYLHLLNMVSLVLPNTTLELVELRKEFNYKGKSRIVPAGVDVRFANSTNDWFKENYPEICSRLGKKFILMVGRIEPRKNQLRVIQSLAGTDTKLLLVGHFNHHHPEYVWRVKTAIKKNANIEHIEAIPYERMGSVFAAASCHVMASFFETTGLVNLEACLAGCSVVSTTKGFGSEYLQDYAIYVDPDDIGSIKKGIMKALVSPFNEDFKKHILVNYTWENVAKLTLKAYEEVLA